MVRLQSDGQEELCGYITATANYCFIKLGWE
jgi:hypothetical protein